MFAVEGVALREFRTDALFRDYPNDEVKVRSWECFALKQEMVCLWGKDQP